MALNENIFIWIMKWYEKNCDGDWEHSFRITIETLDNPGWSVKIDLDGTTFPQIDNPWKMIERTEKDWYGYSISDDQFSASGDPTKLPFLVDIFRQFSESDTKSFTEINDTFF